jgi:hypothetical protein
MTLDRDSILKQSDLVKQIVKVPEWGGEVWVRGMTAKERDDFEASIITRRGSTQVVNMKNVRAKLAAYSICDEDGNLLFSEKDIDELAQKSATALQRIFEVAQVLSGITEEATEELVKN